MAPIDTLCGLAAALALLAPQGASEVVDPTTALGAGQVSELGIAAELTDPEMRDLGFSFRDGWRAPLAEPVWRELRGLELAPAPREDGTIARPPRPLAMRLVLTRASREEKDNAALQSRESWVRVRLEARVELLLEGEQVPRSTDRIAGFAEARSQHGLTSDLYTEAYRRAFSEIAARAAGAVELRVRPEPREETSDSPRFVPFRPWRKR